VTVAPPTVVFWDIDGTLLTTARAGILAWEDAVHEVANVTLDLDDFKTAGLLDTDIAERLLQLAERPNNPDGVRALCDAYIAALPTRLGARRGAVLPNVRAIVSALHLRTDVRQYLLTGNLREGALAKLRHYGLDDLLEAGAFADDARGRAAIARRALDLARVAEGGMLHPDRMYVIGDTPHDVECGQAIGTRTIGVATGAHTSDQLRAVGAWLVLERLPPPGEFLSMLGLLL